MTSRAARRATERDATATGKDGIGRRYATSTHGRQEPGKLRIAAFLAIAAIVIGGGLYFAGNVFFRSSPDGSSAMNMTGSSTVTAPVTGSIDLRVSMDGFDPKVVKAEPGQTLTFDWWNTDGAMHLEGGVHTMVSDSLGIDYRLAAQSRQTISFKAPMQPGSYDYWCDSCCGGKENPGMHARIEVEA